MPVVESPLRADLVLEGGGVKGVGLVGATAGLVNAGSTFPRVAGSSAGAVIAAFVAALQRAGEPLTRLEDVARALDSRRLRDRGRVAGALGFLGPVVDGLAIAFQNGIFEGSYLSQFVEGGLADLGVRSFGDLRIEDPAASLPPEHQYGLVVTASDVSLQRQSALLGAGHQATADFLAGWDFAGWLTTCTPAGVPSGACE